MIIKNHLEQAMNTTENLKKIIQDEKLIPFILGEGDFLTNRPDLDSKRWSELRKFYMSLDSSSPLINIIANTINELFSYESEKAKHSSIAIGLTLKLPETIERIKETITTSEIKKYGEN